jgi:pimeloyl-ACP methyl ester carboxylesterase
MIVTPKPREQTRARYPDEEGYVERDGVRVFYEVYGDAPTTFLLFPTSPISHSRLWKAQIPYLSRHFRVITFDPRGNGRSDRPDTAEAYSYWEFVEDGRAILEATRTETALLAGICDGGGWALMLAATQPATALGVVAIAPCVPHLTPSHPNYRRYPSLEPLDTDKGWAKWNVHYWRRDYRGFLEFFFSEQFRSRTRRSTSRTVSSGASTEAPRHSFSQTRRRRCRLRARRRPARCAAAFAAPCSSSTASSTGASRASAPSPSPNWPAGRWSRSRARDISRRRAIP